MSLRTQLKRLAGTATATAASRDVAISTSIDEALDYARDLTSHRALRRNLVQHKQDACLLLPAAAPDQPDTCIALDVLIPGLCDAAVAATAGRDGDSDDGDTLLPVLVLLRRLVLAARDAPPAVAHAVLAAQPALTAVAAMLTQLVQQHSAPPALSAQRVAQRAPSPRSLAVLAVLAELCRRSDDDGDDGDDDSDDDGDDAGKRPGTSFTRVLGTTAEGTACLAMVCQAASSIAGHLLRFKTRSASVQQYLRDVLDVLFALAYSRVVVRAWLKAQPDVLLLAFSDILDAHDSLDDTTTYYVLQVLYVLVQHEDPSVLDVLVSKPRHRAALHRVADALLEMARVALSKRDVTTLTRAEALKLCEVLCDDSNFKQRVTDALAPALLDFMCVPLDTVKREFSLSVRSAEVFTYIFKLLGDMHCDGGSGDGAAFVDVAMQRLSAPSQRRQLLDVVHWLLAQPALDPDTGADVVPEDRVLVTGFYDAVRDRTDADGSGSRDSSKRGRGGVRGRPGRASEAAAAVSASAARGGAGSRRGGGRGVGKKRVRLGSEPAGKGKRAKGSSQSSSSIGAAAASSSSAAAAAPTSTAAASSAAAPVPVAAGVDGAAAAGAHVATVPEEDLPANQDLLDAIKVAVRASATGCVAPAWMQAQLEAQFGVVLAPKADVIELLVTEVGKAVAEARRWQV